MAKVLISFAVQQVLVIFYPQTQVLSLIGQQENLLQSVSLAAALYCALIYESGAQEVKNSIFKHLKAPWTNEELLGKILNSSFYGFLFACFMVAISIFLGFVKIEAPAIFNVQFLRLLPTLLAQSFFFIVWIILLEKSRQTLLPWLFQSIPASWSLLIFSFFEAHLLYSFYEGVSVPAPISPLKIIFCIFLSLTLNLSYLRNQKSYPSRRYKNAERSAFLCGLWFSFIHVFGQNIADWRAASLMQILQGPLQMNLSYLYLAVLILLTNTMLQSLLKDKVIRT